MIMSKKVEAYVKALGIPREHKCSRCKKITYSNAEQRNNMAECMVHNCAGIWCLVQCRHCGYVDQMYPTSINGIECTEEECKKLFKEIDTIS